MQPPIPIGTVLQNRYRLAQELGQGGFGRTYLAEDLGRFNEKCVIKEFVPLQGEESFSEKATQLFQREAAILYQIRHPQIPQFRATFEQDQRLFLVQDYVAGKTYRDLLHQHRSEGTFFSEAEARQFLQQMLPVLAHIHAKGIIHRDISPENIIQRQSDRLPILIDFGVVKEVVTRIQTPETGTQATSVGKLGYAPSEQVQSGRAYPNSDLYSLAVTAVVLLTGRDPQQLFDDVNLTWNWRRYASVSPSFAQVLNRALSYRPGDRYQSVSEMSQALGAAGHSSPPVTAPTQPGEVNVSEMRTMAAGGRYESPSSATTPVHRAAPPFQKQPDSDSVWENPWAVTAVGVGLAIVSGIVGWAVVNALKTEAPVGPAPPLASPTPTPTATLPPASPTPTPSPTPTLAPAQPVEYNQPLNLRPGDSTSVKGNLKAGDTVNYQIQAEQGQTLNAVLAGEGVLLTVLAPNGDVVDNRARRVLGWQGPLAVTGQFVVQLSPVQGLPQSNYRLELSLSELVETPQEIEAEPPDTELPDPDVDSPQPEATLPEPAVQVEIEEQRVQFPEGRDGILVSNSVGPGRIRRYIVNARQGQILFLQLRDLSGPATLAVRLPGGELLDDASRALFWEGNLPVGGDFKVDVSSPTPSEFTLDIRVKN